MLVGATLIFVHPFSSPFQYVALYSARALMRYVDNNILSLKQISGQWQTDTQPR
jgi:hypothetical protein